jgi:hypothetical protein
VPQLWRQAHDLDRDAGTDGLVFTVVSTKLAGVTDSERIDDRWLLTPADRARVMTKRRASRLGFAVLLTFFRERGRFPRDPSEIEAQGIAALSRQLDIPEPTTDEAFLTGRTAERLRAEIRARFDFREATVADAEQLLAWLRDHAAAMDRTPALLLKLRDDPGRPSLASLQDALTKLELIRGIDLPARLFDGALPRELERCRQRVSVEVPRDLRRHPEPARIAWLAAFVYLRARSLTDDLANVLIETIHRIGARAERKVERELLEDLKRVSGKQNLLFELADAALAQADGLVREVVLPVVSEQTLQDLVKEWKATGPTYRAACDARKCLEMVGKRERGKFLYPKPRLTINRIAVGSKAK